MSWSRSEVTFLIEEYQKYPCLYAVKNEQYKNKHAKLKSLNEIRDKLQDKKPDVTLTEIKNKFNNLKTTFLIEHRKVESSKSSGAGTDEMYQPTLWYYESMVFILDYALPRKNIDSFEFKEHSQISESDLSQDAPDDLTRTYILSDSTLIEEETKINDENDSNLETPSSSKYIPETPVPPRVTPSATPQISKGKSNRKRNLDEDGQYMKDATAAVKNISDVISEVVSNKAAESQMPVTKQDEIDLFGTYVASKMRLIDNNVIRLRVEEEIMLSLFSAIRESINK